MKDKEWLLSFDCPLRFIFSHSALKEGWDNPNVFQICTLIEQKSTFTARQKVGRGLRLCVNQEGERIEDKNINVLHVMANESFAEFADTLQKEIEQETGVKFGILQISLFSGMVYKDKALEEKRVSQSETKQLIDYMANKGYINTESTEENPIEKTAPPEIELPKHLEAVKTQIVDSIAKGETPDDILKTISQATYTQTVNVEKAVTYDEAKELIEHFEKKGYVTKTGKIKDTMKSALLEGTLDLPEKFEAARDKFEKIISRADRKPPIRDASKDVRVKLKKKAMLSPEFLQLWDKIKHRTVYRVSIDDNELKKLCLKELSAIPEIPKAKIVTRTANINMELAGVSHHETGLKTLDLNEDENRLPDFLKTVVSECFIPSFLAVELLMESGKWKDFLNNPQLMTEQFIEVVKTAKNNMEIDGISYKKIDGEEYYIQEIFDSNELIANLDKNAVAVERSIYDYVIYDSSTVEKPFALALDDDKEVEMFFKIPDKFKIETPIGMYNPDWAIYLNKNGEKKLYFVLETKGSLRITDLRTPEQQKIHCGQKYFEAVGEDVQLQVARSWDEFKIKN